MKDEYELLIDDIRETASVCIQEDNQREIVFDRLDKLEKINSELLEADEDYIDTMESGNIMNYEEIERLGFKFNKAIKKAKGDDE